jgi:hypothetical protein
MTELARRVLPSALLGVGSGAAAATAFELADPQSFFYVFLLYVVPGLVFGAIFGAVLWHRRVLAAVRAVIYALAAAFCHAVAVFTAIELVEPLRYLLGGGDNPGLIACGVIAGAVGGGLLGVVTTLLAPVRGWALLAATGALLGVFLPIAVDVDALGPFIFYVIWQGGYAAVLGLILPRIEQV